MKDNYNQIQDPTAGISENDYYDFLQTCVEVEAYEQGLKVLKLDQKELPQYMIDQFKPIFEQGIKKGLQEKL